MAPQLKVITDAIRADAKLWDQQVAPAQQAANAIQPLHLEAVDIPLAILVKDAINNVVPLFQTLASGAGPEFGQIASDLRLNAQAYEDNEADVTAHVDNAY